MGWINSAGNEPVILATLAALAESIRDNWESAKSVDWSEAEQLHRECAKVNRAHPFQCPADLTEIVNYGSSEDEWDSEIVGAWPDRIIEALEDSDKQFAYKPDGENWEVAGICLNGEVDWVGTVSTETVARALTGILQA